MAEMYAESIPKHCPPKEAFEPEGLGVYRLLEAAVPTAADFQSHAVRWPEQFGGRRDCNVWSLSVFTSRFAVNRILGLRAHRHKKVARLVLLPESGKVKQSGQDQAHYSWWRYAGFDPIPVCEVEQ